MARKSITFTEQQENWINDRQTVTGASDAEIVRRCVQTVIDQHPKPKTPRKPRSK